MTKRQSIAFLELDQSGVYVLGSGFSSSLPPNSVPSPDQSDPFKFNRCYLVEGALVERPLCPRPEVRTGGGYQILSCPAGSLIVIRDVIGEEVMAEITTSPEEPDVQFDLPDAGEYMVEVNAPLPFINTQTTIEVD